VRESQGVELAEIAARTKIARTHLAAIEEEQFGQLPASVYVRGFLAEMAKFLRLDPAQVQKTYLRRMRASDARKGLD
jgi:flagellar biosynthesis protein FlhG